VRHIFYIDELAKLNTKKDSSLHWALTLQRAREDVWLLFEKDLEVNTKKNTALECYQFSGDIRDDFYIYEFKLKESQLVNIEGSCFYYRLDPPVNSDYLRSSWLVEFLSKKANLTVINNPLSVIKLNEKILAFEEKNSLESLITSSYERAFRFSQSLGVEEIIIKPLNSYSGLGVEKISLSEFKATQSRFESGEKFIVQAFDETVYNGEIRSVFWKARELGSMIKYPRKGSFLSNIAQGASFEKIELTENLKTQCIDICKELLKEGVDLVAFDILGDNISEVNITCPGLLVELSHACGENISAKLF